MIFEYILFAKDTNECLYCYVKIVYKHDSLVYSAF